MNKNDIDNIKKINNPKKVIKILEDIENDVAGYREKIIWTCGERNGRIPPVMFDYLRALVYEQMGGLSDE